MYMCYDRRVSAIDFFIPDDPSFSQTAERWVSADPIRVESFA